MARIRSSSHSSEIESLVRDFASRLEEAVRRAVAEQLDATVAARLGKGAARAAAGPAAGRAGAVRMCPVPGCTKPAAGPRNRWHCRDHRDVPLGKPVRAAAAEVRFRRLPPGPTPGTTRRTGPSMACRVPGCNVKSKGPRFNFFCADHSRSLSFDQQREFTAQWKAAREAPGTAPRPASGTQVIIRRAGQTLRSDARPEGTDAPPAPVPPASDPP